jgi:hypothetical protein
MPITSATSAWMSRPPYIAPLDHIYLRSRSLLPNGLAQMVNNANINSGLIQTDIICRIPYNEGVNYALAGDGGFTFQKPNGSTVYAPNVTSGYSGDHSQWQWKNQSGKDFSFFVPSNVISQIQFELTNFQGTPLTDLTTYEGASATFLLRKNGYGIFLGLRFDVLE